MLKLSLKLLLVSMFVSGACFAGTYSAIYLPAEGCKKRIEDASSKVPKDVKICGLLCAFDVEFDAENDNEAIKSFKDKFCSKFPISIKCSLNRCKGASYIPVVEFECLADKAKLQRAEIPKPGVPFIVLDKENKPVECN